MIDLLGWVSTALVLLGYTANARGLTKLAMVTWITGDIGWVIYDIHIQNASHMVLSLVIIAIKNSPRFLHITSRWLQKTKIVRGLKRSFFLTHNFCLLPFAFSH